MKSKDSCVIIPRVAYAAKISVAASSYSKEEMNKRVLSDLLLKSTSSTNDVCTQSSNDYTDEQIEVLILQCHSEGVLWKGLIPLFSSKSAIIKPTLQSSLSKSERNACSRRREKKRTSSSPQTRALSILITHFRHRMIEVVSNDGECCTNLINDDGKSFHCFATKAQYHHQVILIVLPHSNAQYYSRTSSARPTNLFALRLISYEKAFIQLTSLSAYISTLGGGCFLCKYLSTAVALARRQCAIALIRGDNDMALKCRINEGYCYIHAGKFVKGRKVIRRVLRDVLHLQQDEDSIKEDGLLHHAPEKELSELTIIKNMCYSALRLSKLMKEMVLAEESSISSDNTQQRKESSGSENDKSTISNTHDDYQRIRIVNDRKWI